MTMSESPSSSSSSSSSSSDGEDSSTSSSRSSSSSSSSVSSFLEDDNSSQIMNGTKKFNSSQSRQSNATSPSLAAAKYSNINNITQQYEDSLQLLSTLIKSKASRATEVSWRSITTRGSVQHDSQEEFDELCHRFVNDNEDHWDLPLWKLAQVVLGRLRDEADNHYKNMNESLESSSSSSNSNNSSSSSNSSSFEEVGDNDAHQNENECSTTQIDLAKHSSDENSSASSEVETIGESSGSDESSNSNTNNEQRDSSPLGMEIETQDSASLREDATGKDVVISSAMDDRLNDKDGGEDIDIDGSSTSSSTSSSSESTREENLEGGDNHFDYNENSSIQSEGDASHESKSINDNDIKSKRSGATLHKTLSSLNGKARTTIAATEQSKFDNELDTEINQSSSSSSPSSSSDNSTSSSSSSSSSEGGEDNQHHEKDEDHFEFNRSQDILYSDDEDFLQTNTTVDTDTLSKLSTPDNHGITTTVEKNVSATKEKGSTDKSESFQSSLPSRASPRRSRAKRKLFQEVEENCSSLPSKSTSPNSGSNKIRRTDVEHYKGEYFPRKSEAYSKAAARPRKKAAIVAAASISVGGKSQKVGESGEVGEGADDTSSNIEATFSKEAAVVRPRRKAAVVVAASISTGRNRLSQAEKSEEDEDEAADTSSDAKAKEATGGPRRKAASLALDSISKAGKKQTKARVSKSKNAQEKAGNDTINPPSPKKATAKPRKRKAPATKSITGKRNRSQCTVKSCTNQARSKGLCQRHGAKVTMCSYEGCPNQAIREGICIRHGARPPPKKKGDRLRCVVQDCQNFAKKGGVCIRHGAVQTRARCKFQGCTKQGQRGGYCIKHGAEVFCNEVIGGTSQEGELCPSPEVCIPVAATKRVRNYTRCSVGDCEKYAQQGGLCIEHGAEVTKCRVKGCKSNAKKLGLCKLHGAYKES